MKYQATDVVVWDEQGMILQSGGWKTVTTKARMNEALPQNVTLWHEKGCWYLSFREAEDVGWRSGKRYEYADGVKISYNGKLLSELTEFTEDSVKASQKKVRRIKKYANAFMDELEAGHIEAPDNGDCWACVAAFNSDDGVSVFGNSHLESHIEESYFVPSLLWAALEHGNTSPSMKWWVQAMIEHTNKHIGNERQRVTKVLANYMKLHMGVAR